MVSKITFLWLERRILFLSFFSLIFRMPNLELDDAWDIMWSVGITGENMSILIKSQCLNSIFLDFVIRFLAMVLKCLVLLACNQCIMNKKKVRHFFFCTSLCVVSANFQGKYFMLIEQIAQFYRLLLPFPLWLNFFSMYNDLSSAVSALFFTGLYTLLKVCTYI